MTTEVHGVVVTFDRDRGFGFIRVAGLGEDVFVHASDVLGGDALVPGQRVRFAVEPTDRGPRAVRVRLGTRGLTPAVASSASLLGLVGAGTLGLWLIGAPPLAAWLIPINAATLAAWAWDRHRAVRDGRRVPEAALLGLAALGGTIGALVGVFGLGHKRRKGRFLFVLGAIAAAQVALAAAVLAR